MLGLLDLTLGRPDEATERLLHLTATERPEFNPLIGHWSIPDLIEAAARSGRLEETADRFDRYANWVRVLAFRAPPVRAGALPGADGGWGRARAIRGGAGAGRVRLAIPDGAHRAPLRRVAPAPAPAARGTTASAKGGRSLPPGRHGRRGRSAPKRSSVRQGRRPGSGTPRRSTSSHLRSCRSPAWSPPG